MSHRDVSLRTISRAFKQLAVALLLANVPAQLVAAEQPQVFVSVAPQRFLVEQISGDAVNVALMVKSGESPATYSPSPRQVASLASAELYFRIGVPFESAWLQRIQAINPDLKFVDMSDGVALRHFSDDEAHEHDREHAHNEDHADDHGADEHLSDEEHHGKELDPHIWTDPLIMIAATNKIEAALSELMPDQVPQFQRNATVLRQNLSQLHDELTALFTGKANRSFLVFHPAWGYLAERYQLKQIAIEFEGKEPGARALAEIISKAQKAGARAIFVQPQFSQKAAQQVARAIGGQVHVADPLSEDYLNNLRTVARQIAEAGLH